MEYQSVNFNAAKAELAALEQLSGTATASLEAQLGGSVVAGYDKQVNAFTAELIAANDEKTAVQADKISLTKLMGGLTDVPEAKGYAYKDSQNVSQKFSGKAHVMGEADYAKFEKLAASAGIDTSAVAASGKSRAVAENVLQAVKDALDSKLSDLNSTSELKLIRYQGLMDARKQAMLMLSNMLSSDNQTRMAVIQNLKG